jgi:quercetin dioxygenase-like cupin family protein
VTVYPSVPADPIPANHLSRVLDRFGVDRPDDATLEYGPVRRRTDATGEAPVARRRETFTMKRAITIILVIIPSILTGCQQDGSTPRPTAVEHKVVLPDAIDWKPAPPSMPAGAKVTVLEGDPSKPGLFTIRGWFPDGYHLPPHAHPNVERTTVLSGTWCVGEGDVFDLSRTTPLPAGSYATTPPGKHHFAYAKGETVVQVTSVGPWGLTYVNPTDDPRDIVGGK